MSMQSGFCSTDSHAVQYSCRKCSLYWAFVAGLRPTHFDAFVRTGFTRIFLCRQCSLCVTVYVYLRRSASERVTAALARVPAVTIAAAFSGSQAHLPKQSRPLYTEVLLGLRLGIYEQ